MYWGPLFHGCGRWWCPHGRCMRMAKEMDRKLWEVLSTLSGKQYISLQDCLPEAVTSHLWVFRIFCKLLLLFLCKPQLSDNPWRCVSYAPVLGLHCMFPQLSIRFRPNQGVLNLGPFFSSVLFFLLNYLSSSWADTVKTIEIKYGIHSQRLDRHVGNGKSIMWPNPDSLPRHWLLQNDWNVANISQFCLCFRFKDQLESQCVL